jgi:hypothetical protein
MSKFILTYKDKTPLFKGNRVIAGDLPISPFINSYTYSSGFLQGCEISYDSDYVYCMTNNATTPEGISYVYFFDVNTGVFSHTISVPYDLKSLRIFNDDYLRGVTLGVATGSRYIQISSTGSNDSVLYTNTGFGSSNIGIGQAYMSVNNRIYTGSQQISQPANGDHVFSASASLSTLVESNNFSAADFSVTDLLNIGSDRLLLLQNTYGGSGVIRFSLVSVPTYSVSNVDTSIFSTLDYNSYCQMDWDGNDTVLAAVARTSSYESKLIKYNISTGGVTSSISLSDKVTLGVSYCSSNNSFYFIDSTESFTFSVSKTSDFVNYDLVYQDYNSQVLSDVKYIPSLNSICIIYAKLEDDFSITTNISFIGL